MTRKQTYGLIAADIAHVGVYILEKSDSLFDVIDLMNGKNISAVIIEDISDLSKYYIITHRDIIRFFSQQPHLFENPTSDHIRTGWLNHVRAKDLMRGPIKIVNKKTPIDEIVHIMNRRGYKRVIVGNEKEQPIGVISTKDIIAWTKDILPKGLPIMLCVMENTTGLIIARYVFRDDIAEEYLDLFGGIITAIEGITDEIMKNSGDLRFIEKDFYDIMLEQTEDITVILVCDESSIELRIELQVFTNRFIKLYYEELQLRKKSGFISSIDKFNIRQLAEIFK